MPAEHERVVRAYVEAFNRGDVDGVVACFALDAVIQGVLGSGPLAVARPIWEDLVRCFGMQLTVEAMLSAGDEVAVRFRERGVSKASFRGGPVTGRAYEGVAMEWFEVGDGRIRRRWAARDGASIFRQMGLPSPS